MTKQLQKIHFKTCLYFYLWTLHDFLFILICGHDEWISFVKDDYQL